MRTHTHTFGGQICEDFVFLNSKVFTKPFLFNSSTFLSLQILFASTLTWIILFTQNALSPHWLTSSSSPPQVFAPISPFQQGLNQHFCWKLQPLNSMPDPPSCPTLNFLFPQHLSPTALAQFLENRAGRNTIPGKQKWGKRGVKQRIEERRPKGVCFPITTGLQATMTWFTERLQRGWTKLMQPQTTSPGKEKRMCPSASVSCW